MAGRVYKRCTKCGNQVKQRTCGKGCGASFKWAFTLYLAKDANGRWLRRLRGGFATKAEAERALHELVSTIDQGAFVEASSVTLGRFLSDEWLPATAPPQVKYETWKDRKRNLEAHVTPHLGTVRLQDLNAAHLNRLYADLLRAGRVDDQGGLSPTTVRRIHAMLRKALNDAVRWGRIQRNPVAFADPPPMKAVRAARRRGMSTWSAAQLRRFLDATHDHQLGTAWLFAASTGVRRSELLGLRWADVSLDGATVTVRQTVVDSEDGFRPEEDQKSSLSARTIHIDKRIVDALHEHRGTQDRARRAAGPAWQGHDLVFPQSNGSWWNPPAISLAFGRAVKTVDVPPIRLHDLRHTHATLLLSAGVNPKVVSERLGHSSVSFTLDTYAHVMPGMQPEAAKIFMDLVEGEQSASLGEGCPDDREAS